MCNVACTRRAEGTGRVRNCATCGGDVTSTAACERILLHEIMATPPAAQAGQDGSLDMATRVPLGTTGIVVTQSVAVEDLMGGPGRRASAVSRKRARGAVNGARRP